MTGMMRVRSRSASLLADCEKIAEKVATRSSNRWGSSLYSLYALLSWILRTRPSVSLIVNLRSPATDTFADGRVRARARANSWVKAGGVSISAQIAAQIATTEN